MRNICQYIHIRYVFIYATLSIYDALTWKLLNHPRRSFRVVGTRSAAPSLPRATAPSAVAGESERVIISRGVKGGDLPVGRTHARQPHIQSRSSRFYRASLI